MPEAPGALPQNFTLLQVTPRLDIGGVEAVTTDTAAAVVRAGGRSLLASWGGRLEETLACSGARLIRLPVHAKDPITLAANAARLAALIQRERVSLVHVRSRAPAFSALLAARATGVPLVATYHGIYGARTGLKRWYNAVMTRGDVIIANSTFTRDHILAEHRLDATRLVVVPEGVDTARFDPAAVIPERVAAVRAAWGLDARDRRPVIVLAARWTWWKGHRLLVEALGRMPGRDKVVLILTGAAGAPSDEVAAVEAAATVAGLAGGVRIVGPCDDMPAAWLAADLAVAPSTAPESFGRSVVEAGAMARPVLASSMGAPAETVIHGQTGWLAPPGDIEAWTAALETALAAEPEALAAMGRAARERVRGLYSLDAMCEATFSVYRRALERRP
jgi:glycosyltransferase involved in cell wall biosynthesis